MVLSGKNLFWIIIIILAILYLTQTTVEVARDPDNTNKSNGEIAGMVAINIAKDVGDIIRSGYEQTKSQNASENVINLSINETNVSNVIILGNVS